MMRKVDAGTNNVYMISTSEFKMAHKEVLIAVYFDF
jgi:hypothetical protein